MWRLLGGSGNQMKNNLLFQNDCRLQVLPLLPCEGSHQGTLLRDSAAVTEITLTPAERSAAFTIISLLLAGVAGALIRCKNSRAPPPRAKPVAAALLPRDNGFNAPSQVKSSNLHGQASSDDTSIIMPHGHDLRPRSITSPTKRHVTPPEAVKTIAPPTETVKPTTNNQVVTAGVANSNYGASDRLLGLGFARYLASLHVVFGHLYQSNRIHPALGFFRSVIPHHHSDVSCVLACMI